MAVEKISLLSGREASFGKITEGKSKLKWLGVTNNRYDTELELIDYSNSFFPPLLPTQFVDYHPFYPIELCRNVSFSQDSGAPCKWEIVADYSSEPLRQSDTQIADPMKRAAKIKWKTNQYRKAMDKDVNGKALVNSAGDYFDPPPEADRSHWTATITKNVPQVPQIILPYSDAINSNGFLIQGMTVAPFVAKIMDIDISELQIEGDFEYYTFTYSLEFRPEELWHPYKILDQGYRFKSSTLRKQIMDDSTPPRPVTSPKLLDGSGNVLANPTTTNAIFISYTIYTARDFTILPGLSEVGS